MTAIVAGLLTAWPPVSSAGSRTDAGVRASIRAVFGPRAPVAECIAAIESTGTRRHYDPRAVGRLGERGIFQIHPVHFGEVVGHGRHRLRIVADRLFDPAYNARVAFAMSGGGRYWRPAWQATAGRCGA